MSIICEICLEEFQSSFNSEKTPRILSCGDTFCTHCLRQLKKDNKIICPVCKTEISNGVDKIEKICVNKFVINLVEKKILSAIKHLDNRDIKVDKTDFQFSIGLIGDSGVGKTSIGNFYKNGEASEISPLSTISLDNSFKFLSVHHKTVKITLWDTAGEEKYRSLSIGYLRGVHAIILVFSLTNLIAEKDFESFNRKSQEEKNSIKNNYKNETFENLKYWIKQCKQFNAQKTQIIYLVGNKVDIDKDYRFISQEDSTNFAMIHNLRYYETSAKTGENINKVFDNLAYELMGIYSEDIDEDNSTIKSSKLSKKSLKKPKKNKCC